MTVIWARVLNVGNCIRDDKGEIQAEDLREENTEARSSDGITRSSVEIR